MGRVFVAGSINMDVVATADRHPRIGETVAGSAVLYFPGGKGANRAVAAAKLGTPTTLIGRLGKDAFGDQFKAFLAAEGIDLSFVQQTSQAHTGKAHTTVATPASSKFPCPPSAPSSNAPARRVRRRSSIRRQRSNSAANYSISSIF